MALAYGLGTTKDLLASRHWLAGAANQGHQEAQYVLGAMLLEARRSGSCSSLRV